MITFPNAKINLGLNITEKRPDGYHNLETIFYPIPLEDALEACPRKEGPGSYSLSQSGLSIEGDTENNLVVKAYKLLDETYHLPPVDIYLHKHIPSGAGLGGGSADAAFMLKLLNRMYRLNLTDDQLEAYAARLSRLCFLYPQPTDIRRGHREYFLASKALAGRLAAAAGKTGYLCFHPRRLRPHPSPPPGTQFERPHQPTRGKLEGLYDKRLRGECVPSIPGHRRHQDRALSSGSRLCLDERFRLFGLRSVRS